MKKFLFIVVLIFLFSYSSVTVYSYYEDSDMNYLNDETAIFLINGSLRPTGNEKLIPLGAVQKQGDTYEIVYKYEILIPNNELLDVSINNILSSNDHANNGLTERLFNFDFEIEYEDNVDYKAELFQDSLEVTRATVTLRISMNMPATQEEYFTIKDSKITFNVLFTLSN